MQISYRYTKREYLHSRRINRMLRMPKWKSLGLTLACLLPSFVLITFTNSFIALIAFTAVAAYLIAMICLALLKQPKLSDEHDHIVTLSPEALNDTSSHSEYEIRWQYFDEFSENETEFLLRRLDRYITLPKRVFTPHQCEQFRSFALQVGEGLSEDKPAIPMFTKLFANADQNRVYRFTYQPEDLIQAATDRLVLIDATQMAKKSKTKPTSNWFIAGWLGIFFLGAFFLLQIPGDTESQWSPLQYLFLASALVLPFVLLLGFSKYIRIRSAKRLPQVPHDENRLCLLKQGFAIGTPNNVTFYDWRDIDAFYENGSCYGFKSFNELIQIIPKRLFADNVDSTGFLNQAISLHREYRRTFELTATAIETGNPYQPPAT